MSAVPVRFVIGEVTQFELEDIQHNLTIASKLILTPDDFRLFKYREGDEIEIESEVGQREWCQIRDLEIIEGSDEVIVLFTLERSQKKDQNC